MKRLLLSLIIGMSLHEASVYAAATADKASKIVEFTEVQSLSNDRLFHDGSSFMVQRLGKTHQVPVYNVNRDIRSQDIATLVKLQEHGYFDVQRSVEGNEVRINFQPRLKAGGVGGANAGFWTGRFLGYGLVYGLTAIACLPALAAGPATYAVVFKAASLTVAPVAEAAATTLSVAGGVAGGVATGPV